MGRSHIEIDAEDAGKCMNTFHLFIIFTPHTRSTTKYKLILSTKITELRSIYGKDIGLFRFREKIKEKIWNE